MTLQRYLTRLVWLSALPLLALALWLGYARFAAERDSEDARAGRLAERLAQVLDHALQARISALQVLARSPLLHESRWPELHAAAAGFREGFGGEVMVVDAERRWRLHSSVPVGDALPTLPRPQGRSAVDVVFASGRPAVGDPFRGPVAQEPMVAIGVPVRRDGGVPLMLANVMPLRQLDSILNEPAIPAGWSAALRDSQGREIWARAGAGSPGPSNGDRETVLRYADDLSAAPWAVEVQIPRVTYVQHLAETGAWLLLTLVGVLTVSVLFGRWGRQRLARSVQTLVAADGPGWPADEIDEFRRARRLLEDTLAQRAAADDALKVREGQLRGIFETATEAIVTADADKRIVLANPAAARVCEDSTDENVLIELKIADDLAYVGENK